MRFAGVPNVSHEYSKSPNLPRGLYILGDAFMALNPIYAQGMTVATAGAILLDRTFREALHTGQIKAKIKKSSFSMALCVSPSNHRYWEQVTSLFDKLHCTLPLVAFTPNKIRNLPLRGEWQLKRI